VYEYFNRTLRHKSFPLSSPKRHSCNKH